MEMVGLGRLRTRVLRGRRVGEKKGMVGGQELVGRNGQSCDVVVGDQKRGSR